MNTLTPNIDTWVDEAGLNPNAFRLLARIARRAGPAGVCHETVPNMARGCRISEKTAQRHLPTLVKTGLVKVVKADTPRTPKHYALAAKMHLDGKALVALFNPAWVDSMDLSAEAFRLYYHYLSNAYEGVVKANRARAARACFGSEKSTLRVRNAEAELLRAGFIGPKQRQGKHDVFVIRRTKTETLEAWVPEVQATEPPTCDTPNQQPNRPPVTPLTPTCDTPNRPPVTPEGLLEVLPKGSKDNDNKNLEVKTEKPLFKELLKNDYAYFTKLVAKSGDPETVMAGWLAAWGETRIREVWAYLSEHRTPWHEANNNRDARLYGLNDTLQGDFKEGQPQRFCALQYDVQQEARAKRRAAIPRFERYNVVRVGDDPTEYTVLNSAGPTTFFDTDLEGRQYASSYDCTLIRHAPPEEPTEHYEPPIARLKREARERRQQQFGAVRPPEVAQWTQ